MYNKFFELLITSRKTTYQVAKETGISNTTFSDWKKGKSKPKFEKLILLAKYFDVPVEYFADDAKASEKGDEDA